ncbi:hypothetical protein BDD12DRAFT_879104 [Trichophaea hybrida]|nr:hypothetical protein BDD12DRAFT_879104 [Trichophaea hybrida]
MSIIPRTYLDTFNSHRLGSSTDMLKTLWTDTFGSHRTASCLVRRAVSLSEATRYINIGWLCFWAVVFVVFVSILVVWKVREWGYKREMKEYMEMQRVVRDVTAETV